MKPFCKANNNKIGCYNVKNLFPRNIIERNKALFLYDINFCLIWKSEGFHFIKAVEEVKSKFIIVDVYKNNLNVNCYFQ